MAAVSLACHNRAEDEVGAAPEQTDTTAVTHVIDSTRTGPPGVGGRPGNATVTPDSVGADSAVTSQEPPAPADTTSTWSVEDTTTMKHDSTTMHESTMPHDSTLMQGDSAMTGHPVPDTTSSQ